MPALVAAKVLGIGLGAVQLLPTADALADSVRDAPTPEFLAMLSLPPRNIVLWLVPYLYKTTTKNAAKTPQINKRNRLPLSALRCHRDRLSTTILAPFLAVVLFSKASPIPSVQVCL